MTIIDPDWLQYLFKLLVAFVLALPVGWDRERQTRIMGMRTFPLVAVASAAYVLLSVSVLEDNLDAQARIIQGLITGIGFIGGGAIIKEPGRVKGTATAVSVWSTGVMGASVAYGNFGIALIISLINFLTLWLLPPILNNFKNKRTE